MVQFWCTVSSYFANFNCKCCWYTSVKQADREILTCPSLRLMSGLRQCFPVASPSSLGSRCLSLSLSLYISVCAAGRGLRSRLTCQSTSTSTTNQHGLAHLDAARLFGLWSALFSWTLFFLIPPPLANHRSPHVLPYLPRPAQFSHPWFWDTSLSPSPVQLIPVSSAVFAYWACSAHADTKWTVSNVFCYVDCIIVGKLASPHIFQYTVSGDTQELLPG